MSRISSSQDVSRWFYALTFGTLALIMPEIALAADGGFTQSLGTNLAEAVDTARRFTYILAAAGIVVMAILAFFGKFSWVRLLYIVIGVILVAGAFEIINQLSDGFSGGGGSSTQFL